MSKEPTQENEPLMKPRKRWRFWLWFGVVLIFGFLMMVPFLRRKLEYGDAVMAEMNGECLAMMFISFEGNYGFYPNEKTREMILHDFPESKSIMGATSSNDFMRQLNIAGYIDSEMPFYLPVAMAKRPDNEIGGQKFLSAGECGWSYVVWENKPSNPKAPLLMSPMISGELKFDRRWANTAVVVLCDCSVKEYKINPDGHVMIEGKDFFDPSQPYWGGVGWHRGLLGRSEGGDAREENA